MRLASLSQIKINKINSTTINYKAVGVKAARIMRTVPGLLWELANPRGRCNRSAFLQFALGAMAFQFALSMLLWLFDIEIGMMDTIKLNAPVAWLGITVCIKRLHDIGRAGWWMPASFIIWVVSAFFVTVPATMIAGTAACLPGQPVFYLLVAGITLPAFLALTWVHTAASAKGWNKYGPVPGKSGLSLPRRKPRPARAFFAGPALA